MARPCSVAQADRAEAGRLTLSIPVPQAASVAAKYGIPEHIFTGLIHEESRGNQNAKSSAGAIGYTQLMPSTAKGLGVNPYDPQQNLDGGARYLRQQYDTFGSWKLALAAYNAGPGAVKQYGGVPPYAETQAYVRNILGAVHPGATKPPQGTTAPLRTTQAGGIDTKALALDQLSHIGDPGGTLSDATSGAFNFSAHPQSINFPKPAVKGAATGSSRDQKAVALIKEYLGTPYVWGGSKPGGFDCSGLLQYVWSKEGVSIPRTSFEQFLTGRSIPKSNLRVGDAVFFKGSDSQNGLPGHVGMYIGGGKFVEAPHTGATVRISALAGRTDYVGARRFG